MKVLSLRSSGLLGFEDVDIDFRGAASVIGVRGLYPGQTGRSNRAGKSRLVYDLPLFALSGWSRTGNVRDVVSRGRGTGWAEVELETPSGVLRVRRTATLGTSGLTASVKTELAGAEGAREDEAQNLIEERLGLPVEDLRRVSLFEQGDVMGFLSGDQKRTLMRWLDQEHWKRAETEAGTRLREADRAAVRAGDALRAAQDAEKDLPRLRAAAEEAGVAETTAETTLRTAEEAVRCETETSALRTAEADLRVAEEALRGAEREKAARVSAAEAALRAARTEAETALREAKATAAATRRERTATARREVEAAEHADAEAAAKVTTAGQAAERTLRAVREAEAARDRELTDLRRVEERVSKEEGDLRRLREGGLDAPCHVTDTTPCAALRLDRETEKARLLRTAEERVEAAKEDLRLSRERLDAAKKKVVEVSKTASAAGLSKEIAASAREDTAARLRLSKEDLRRVDREAEEEERAAVEEAEEDREDADATAVATRDLAVQFSGGDAAARLRERDAARVAAEQAAEALRRAQTAAGVGRLPDLRREAAEARDAASRARVAVSSAEKAVEQLEDLDAEAGRTERRARALRILRAAFGKDGIPARVVEGYIDDLAADANTFLEHLGMDARIAWRTWRELAKWREDCHACGSPDRTGRGTALRCAECGAPWRRARAEDFACVLRTGGQETPLASDSGGGKTLVALSVRFALSQLVSRARGVEVDSLVLDEPFSALDGPNLSAAVSLVSGTLGAYGVRQVLLVSHLPELQDCVGDLITVVREGDLSRVETSWGG